MKGGTPRKRSRDLWTRTGITSLAKKWIKRILTMSSLLQSYMTSSERNVNGGGRYCPSIRQITVNMSPYLVSETRIQWSQQLIWSWSQIFIHSLILLSVLRQGHSLFQSNMSTEGDLALPLSISKLLYFS